MLLCYDIRFLPDFSCVHRPSHLRRAIFGPSNGGLYVPLVARLASKQQTGLASLLYYHTWPVYSSST